MSSVLENEAIRTSALMLGTDQYRQLCESGVIPEKTELLEGVVVRKMGKSPLHSWTVEFLAEWLNGQLERGRFVRMEQPLTLSDSEPEPDLAVVLGHRDDYRDQHPGTAALVVEVAVSSEDVDRAKSRIYAAAGIPTYWLVLPKKREVVVFSEPSADGYQSTATEIDQIQLGQSILECTQLFPTKK